MDNPDKSKPDNPNADLVEKLRTGNADAETQKRAASELERLSTSTTAGPQGQEPKQPKR